MSRYVVDLTPQLTAIFYERTQMVVLLWNDGLGAVRLSFDELDQTVAQVQAARERG